MSYQYWQIDLKLEKKMKKFADFREWTLFPDLSLNLTFFESVPEFPFSYFLQFDLIDRESNVINHYLSITFVKIYSLSVFKLSAIPISLMRSNKKNYFFAYEATNNNIKNIFAFLCHPKKLVNLYTRISFDDIDSRNVRQKNGERINE